MTVSVCCITNFLWLKFKMLVILESRQGKEWRLSEGGFISLQQRRSSRCGNYISFLLLQFQLVNANQSQHNIYLWYVSVFQGCQSGVRSLYATADLLSDVS